MTKIILCADDYGQNQSISQAIITLLEKNRLSATSCMTTSSLWPVHAEWLKPWIHKADIGLHFNLTEGIPLSKELARSHGFLPLSKLILKAYFHTLNAGAIEAELHAQLDAFEARMGEMPRFIDGHQHIHQLPVIRKVLFKVYEERLRASHCYIRCVYTPKSYLRRGSYKRLIIQLLGAKKFKKKLVDLQVPHNSSFSGIYSFADASTYSTIFPHFLKEVREEGIIMCHPALSSFDKTDAIAKARYQEFLYLNSDQFVSDCLEKSIDLGRLPKKTGIIS